MTKLLSFSPEPFDSELEFEALMNGLGKQGESFEQEEYERGSLQHLKGGGGSSHSSASSRTRAWAKTGWKQKRPSRFRPLPYPLAVPSSPLITQPDSPDMGSDVVSWAQTCLNGYLGLTLPVDGVLDLNTRNAIRTFQERQGLPTTGRIGPKTEAALKSACQPPQPSGPAPSDELSSEFELRPFGRPAQPSHSPEGRAVPRRDLKNGPESAAVKRSVTSGQRDESKLTDLVFLLRHPERRGRKLEPNEKEFKLLSKEWVEIRDRLVRPILASMGALPQQSTSAWPKRLIPILERYRRDIPLEFLIGWIGVESGGNISETTSLGERGYFQIHPDEWKDRGFSRRFPDYKFEDLSRDPDFSIRAGIMLVQGNRDAVTNYTQKLGFKFGPELFWRLVKLYHWTPVGLQATLRHMKQNGFIPKNWDDFRNYMCSKRMEIMNTMRMLAPQLGANFPAWCEQNQKCGLNPKKGIENVEKMFERGRELIGKPGSPIWECP